MRWMLAGVAALTAVGCKNFDSVEEACKDSVRGDKDASFEATEVYRRISCYRRYTGLGQATMNARITEAVEAHTNYLELNGITENWPYEDGGQGFTGETVYDRLDRTEYRNEGEGSLFVWEVLLGVDPAVPRGQMIDDFMHDPFIRDVFLAPAWEGGGYAEGLDAYGDFAYMDIVLYYPSGARSSRPVTYPMDGQFGVPTAWNNYYVGDPAVQGLPALTGYPVTFTVGSNEVGGGANPLNLQVRSSSYIGPSGPVEHVVILPGLYNWGTNWSTAILVPTQPLDPGATYTVEVELSWVSRTKRIEELTFTTSSTAGPGTVLAREAPRVRLTPLEQLVDL